MTQPSFDDAVRETMSRCGVDEMRARFIVALERGEITGDCVEVDELEHDAQIKHPAA
jgi:hypothetical protein